MDTFNTELVERIRSGDGNAVEQAYDAYFTPVMNFVYYTVYDYEAAADISQEAFIKVVEAIGKKRRDVRDFKSYLFATAKNMAFDELKRRRRRADVPVETIVAEDPDIFTDPARAAQFAQQRAQVAVAVSRLNEHQRVALTLKDVDGWSYDDIGGFMGLSQNAVGVLLSRARLKFKKEFRLQTIDVDALVGECRDLLPLMSAVLDGEAAPTEKAKLQAHLDACPLCRETMSEMEGAATTLRSLVPLAPVLALKAGLVAKAAAVAGAGAAAAGVAGAVGGGAAGAAVGAAGAVLSAGVGGGLGAVGKTVIACVSALLIAGAGFGTCIWVKKAVTAVTPSVEVTIPADGETITRVADPGRLAKVKIITAVDNRPRGVELEIDGRVAATLDRGPYNHMWVTDVAGRHTVQPYALDADGKRHPGQAVTFKLIIVKSSNDTIAYLANGDIFTAGLDGSVQKKLTSRGDIRDFNTSPDGARIAFADSNSIIFLMGADGSDVRQVTLPEKGRAGSPAFDPAGKYMYFTRVAPGPEPDPGEPESRYDLRFERYDITANKVDTIYVRGGYNAYWSPGELFIEPSGTALLFNLEGHQWPGSMVTRFTLGPPVSEEILRTEFFAPWIQGETVYNLLTSISSGGGMVAYHKDFLVYDDDSETNPGAVRHVCLNSSSGGSETVIGVDDHYGSWMGDIGTVRFSAADPEVYYFNRVAQPDPAEARIEHRFYSRRYGKDGETPTGLILSNVRVWHVLGGSGRAQ